MTFCLPPVGLRKGRNSNDFLRKITFCAGFLFRNMIPSSKSWRNHRSLKPILIRNVFLPRESWRQREFLKKSSSQSRKLMKSLGFPYVLPTPVGPPKGRNPNDFLRKITSRAGFLFRNMIPPKKSWRNHWSLKKFSSDTWFLLENNDSIANSSRNPLRNHENQWNR